MLDQFEIPKNLIDIGVKDSSIKNLAKKALQDSAFSTNPKNASLEEMEDLIAVTLNNGR